MPVGVEMNLKVNESTIYEKTWFKEVLGIPTYFSVFIIAFFFTEDFGLKHLGYFVLGMVGYSFAYMMVFLQHKKNNNKFRVFSFVFAQLCVWGLVFYSIG